MKKLIVAATLLAATNITATAQDYQKPLQQAISSGFDTLSSQPAKVEATNKFVLIAKKWSNDWAPNYYAAWSRINLSYSEPDEAKKDAYLDEADSYLDNAVKILGKPTDETEVLSAQIANARMAVKPQQRWQQYSKIFDDHITKAKALNADNPRLYMLQGIAKFYMPKMFGGGGEAAMPYFQKADGLFAKQTEGDVNKPYWGKRTNAYFMAQAKGGDKKG